jgi:hypothetical protein
MLLKQYGRPGLETSSWEERLKNSFKLWSNGSETLQLLCYQIDGKGKELAAEVVIARSSDANAAAPTAQTFSRDSAILDKNIPESVREAFADDDGRSMKSISVDLDDDKSPEKLVPNEFLCGNGGCPWLVYSEKLGRVIGQLFGTTITILGKSTGGFRAIQSTSRATTTTYEFHDRHYIEAK